MNVVVEFLWLRGRLCCVCAGLWHFETKEVLTLVSAVESMWSKSGPVAQRIRHLTTNQGIAGSGPARVKIFLSMKILSTRGTIIPPESGVLNTTYQKTKSLQPKLGALVVPPRLPFSGTARGEKILRPWVGSNHQPLG